MSVLLLRRGTLVTRRSHAFMDYDQSLSSSGASNSRLVQANPNWTIWHKCHIRPDQCQLSRCSTGTNGVTCEGYWRQEQLCSDTVFTLDSPLDTSVITSKSQQLVRLLPQSLRPSSLNPSQLSNSYHCKLMHVRPGQCSIPLSKQGHRNNYKKINTGMRCHLVSRLANTSLGNVPVPPAH